MNKSNHTKNCHYHTHSSIIISYNENRERREKCPKNRYESEYKNDNSKRDNVREGFSTMEKAYYEQSEHGKYSIGKGNNRLGLENKSESFCYFSENYLIFFIQKRKISSFHRFQILSDFHPIYQKYITQRQGNKKFCKENSDVFYIFKSPLHHFLNRIWIEDIIKCFIDSEIHIETIFQTCNRTLDLVCNSRGIMDKSFSFIEQVWNERVKQRNYHHYKCNIYKCYNDW